ncbi:MFS transporter [Amycolatopsis silviterrae]|uniref:MFS transporter n=1 Tax=Amycolatopsis silviterrae TaxID=1656914 RepID=A0ABW5GYL8_9PSEU
MHTFSRNAAFAALLLGMLMAALDTNVVVAALPSVGADLGNPGAVGGVTAAYLLAVAVATPVHGSLGDRWGRRRTFVGSVTVFAVASLGCALAPSLPALIGLRAVQGLGGSGLIVAAVTAMAELFDRTEMVRRQGWLTAVFAVSSIGGAPLGGLLAASAGWPWIFLVNLPVSVLALALGIRSVPGKREADRRGFDVAGALLVALVGGSIVALGSSEALARNPVAAPVLAAVALAGTVAFVRVERRAAAPLVPPRLFADPGVTRAVVVTLLTGVALFGSFTYVPLAISENPAATGLLLLPMSIGQVVVTSGFALLARRWPRVTAWGRLGLVLGVVGLVCTASIPLASGGLRMLAVVVGLACSGAALGLSMQAYTLLAQSMVPKDILGAGMATLTFARQIGGSLGIAVFGWITLTVDSGAALPIVFLLAAAVLLAGVLLAPRAAHDLVSA